MSVPIDSAGFGSSVDEKLNAAPVVIGTAASDSEQAGEVAMTVDGVMKLDRKISIKRDCLLIPVLGLMYLILFLDRSNMANANIEGLQPGLDMPSNGYNTALWIFYIPFVLAEIPSNLLLQSGWVRPNLYLGTCMTLLGLLGCCQGLAKTYHGLLAVRFFLGVFESALPAGAAYMMSIYYTKDELAPRFAMFFCFALAGPFFSGLLAYAIENLNGVDGKEGWRWIFIIEGLMTIFFGFVGLLFVPHFPAKAQGWFLKPHERDQLVSVLESSRGQEDVGSATDDVPLWKVLLDWRIHWFTMCFFAMDVTASSMAAFIPVILTQMGYVTSRAQIMTMPIWATGIVSSLTITTLSNCFNIRYPFILAGICVQVAGWVVMVVYVPAPSVRYGALFLLAIGTYFQMPTITSWLSSNLRGKKVCSCSQRAP